MRRKTLIFIVSLVVSMALLLAACAGESTPTVQTPGPTPTAVRTPEPAPTMSPENWTLINPEGVYDIVRVEIASRLTTLDGKTIALRWNGKPGGDIFLDGIAQRLAGEVPTASIIKLYEVDPETATYASSVGEATKAARSIAETYHPDIVIASQAD